MIELWEEMNFEVRQTGLNASSASNCFLFKSFNFSELLICKMKLVIDFIGSW